MSSNLDVLVNAVNYASTNSIDSEAYVNELNVLRERLNQKDLSIDDLEKEKTIVIKLGNDILKGSKTRSLNKLAKLLGIVEAYETVISLLKQDEPNEVEDKSKYVVFYIENEDEYNFIIETFTIGTDFTWKDTGGAPASKSYEGIDLLHVSKNGELSVINDYADLKEATGKYSLNMDNLFKVKDLIK